MKKSTNKNQASRTASGTLTNLQSMHFYEKKALENLRQNTPFMRTLWRACACGSPPTHTVELLELPKPPMHLCDGCHFRYQVMKAAGRLEEFRAEYDEQRQRRDAVSPEEIPEMLKRRPLPARSGKTIQMYKP
jgi:hypothetical protein